MERARAGPEPAQWIGDFAQVGDAAARRKTGRAMADGNGGGQIADELRVGALKAFEVLPERRRETLQEAPLRFGMECIKDEAALAGAAHAADDGQAAERDIDVDAAQVVDANAAQRNGGSHE